MKILKIITLIIYSIFVSIIFLAFLELILYCFTPKYFDRLSYITSIIKQDSILFWKQKENLNREFEKQNLITNSLGFRCHEISNKDKVRYIALGGSPTFGWGVKYEDTYPVVVENNLKQKNIDIEAINAGEIGYSSFQGLNFLKNIILDLKPDILTVSYVINDIDKYRFFRSSFLPDSKLEPMSENIIKISNILQNSNIIKTLKYFSTKLTTNKEKYYGKNFNNQYNTNRRVSLQEYEQNLNKFADIAQENNIDLVFIVMPVNFPGKKELNEEETEKIKTLTDKVKDLIEKKDFIEAKKTIDDILKIDEYLPVAYYYLGIIAQQGNDINTANELFEKAKNYEIFDLAALALKYNDVMRKVAKERDILLCDSAKDFKEYKKDYLFVDSQKDCFHPNDIGHKIIADKLTSIFIDKELYKYKNQE